LSLSVGLGALTPEEERFHFKMWAINKSPLIIGGILDDKFPKHTLDILSKKEIIAINQDPDGKPAHLVRRFTDEEWDVWRGDLSGGKQVLGIANWKNQSRDIEFDLRSIGIESANVRDPWTPKDIGRRHGTQSFDLNAHELKLWVLSNIEKIKNPPKSTGYHNAVNGTRTGSAIRTECRDCQYLSRVQYLGKGSTLTFSYVSTKTPGKKLMGIDFVNFDHDDNNIRRINVAVNGGSPKGWAVPLSGQSWKEYWRLNIEVDGFKSGENTIVFSGAGDGWAPDMVGFDIFE
jgi:alpha-galactosidase